MANSPATTLIIRHGLGTAPAAGEGLEVLWDSAPDNSDGGGISLAERLDKDFAPVLAEFVEWRDSLADASPGGRTLQDALDLEVPRGGALWWASTLVATPPESFGRIADILKLRLLEAVVAGGAYHRVVYRGTDVTLAKVLKRWCDTEGREFEGLGSGSRPAARGLRDRLPQTVQALLYLKAFSARRLHMRRTRVTAPAGTHHAPAVAIATFFPNISEDAAAAGRFESRYWGGLHRLIESLGLQVNWIWFYIDSPQMALDDAVRFRDRLNAATPESGQSYAFLEERVGWWDMARALGLYLRMVRRSLEFRSVKGAFRFPGSTIDFFPLLENEWRSSWRGAHAMFLALYAAACSAAVRAVPGSADRLLYIWENQSWEYLLLDAWKATRQSPTLAAAHAPTCSSPMAMKNQLGRRQRCSVGALRADRLVTIGRPAAAALQVFGWPAEMVVVAEALRYEHLAGKHNTGRRPLPDTNRHLLVLTGILQAEAKLQLELLAAAARLGALDQYAQVSVRAHPFSPIAALIEAVPFDRRPRIATEPLEQLLEEVDVVFSASGTSVSVEVAWLGLPLILLGVVDSVNVSPLRSIPGAEFVLTPAELTLQLQNPSRVPIDETYFMFDSELARWRTLLTAPMSAPCTS